MADRDELKRTLGDRIRGCEKLLEVWENKRTGRLYLGLLPYIERQLALECGPILEEAIPWLPQAYQRTLPQGRGLYWGKPLSAQDVQELFPDEYGAWLEQQGRR